MSFNLQTTGRYARIAEPSDVTLTGIRALARALFQGPEIQVHVEQKSCCASNNPHCVSIPLEAPDGTEAGAFCVALPPGHAGLDQEGRRLLACLARIVRDELELRLASEELRRATHEAQRANRYRAEFTSRMSHELRTPLTSILGIAQLLEQDNLTAPQQEDVARMLRAGRHLLALINEVLDISRVESGRLTLDMEVINAREVLASAVDLVRPLMDQRGIVITFHVPASLPLLCADRQRLMQVLVNLLSNATKYNRERGSIAVSVIISAVDRLRILIRDTGPGIALEDTPRLFQPFERLKATSTQTEGTGLGLALCKTLVEAMSGEIGVVSTCGVGSTFWIQLTSVAGREDETSAPEPVIEEKQQTDLQTGTVLYIEDNATNLALIERAVARALPSVRLFSTMLGRQGIEMASAHKPDLILLDLHLPDMHGREILAKLRKDERTAAIPVIAVSADAAETTRAEILGAGAQDFVAKPVNIASLIRAVGRQLRKESQ